MRGSEPRVSRQLSRRLFLGVGTVAVLALGGVMAAFRTGDDGRAPALLALSAWQYRVVEHAARRIAAPDRPNDPTIPTADELGVAAFADGWVSRMDKPVQRDLGRFLAYVEHVAPLAAGYLSRFTRLSSTGQDRVLASLEASSSGLLRAGFDGLKSLVFLGYYRDARTWNVVGYDGPLVGRPKGGWQ